MRKTKLLELWRKECDYGFNIPAGTAVDEIEKGIGLFVLDVAKYRGITTKQFMEEIQEWVQQLEEHL